MHIGPRLPPLRSLETMQPLTPLRPPAETDAASGGSFGKLLVDQLGQVNARQQQAESAVHDMLTGKQVNQTEVLTAVQKADLSFRLLLQVRNKLMEAYAQLSQMQI